MGQGSSFPWLSRAAGRPAIDESFTVVTTESGCCAAATAALTHNAIITLANLVARVIAHHQDRRDEYDGSSDERRGVQSFAQQQGGQQYSEYRNQVERGRRRGYIQVLQSLEEEKHGCSIHEEGQEQKSGNAFSVKTPEAAKVKRLYPNEQRNADDRCSHVAIDQDFYLLKLLHPSLAIYVEKGRSEATGKDEEIAGEILHRTK